MPSRNLGLCALFCASLGCTQTLDFDSVSAGAASPDGEKNVPCAEQDPKPALCHDFDTDSLGAFGILVDAQNGTATKDTALFVSPPASFLATSKGGKDRTRIVLEKPFPEFRDARVTLTVKFDVYVEEMDPTPQGRITPFVLLMGPLTDSNQIALQFVSSADAILVRIVENTLKVPGDAGYRPHAFDDGLKLKTWTNVRLVMNIETPSGTQYNRITAYLGDKKVLESALELVLKGDIPRTELGIADVSTEPAEVKPWKVRFDNYVLDFARF